MQIQVSRCRALSGPVTATLLVHATLLAAYVAAFHGDVSSLLCVGRDRAGQPPFEAITTGVGATGYDGQSYFLVARAPWRKPAVAIDAPAARHLRIFYPALCWLVSGGNANLLIWAMPVVNLVAIAVLAALGVLLARHYGRSPWWGFLLPLVVNMGMPALRDLTDPLAVVTVVGVLTAWFLKWPGWSLALWAAAAVFSREQNVGVVGLLLLAAVLTRQYPRATGLLAVLLLWLTWVAGLKACYGVWPFLPGQGNLGVPFGGMLHRWSCTFAATTPCRAALIHILGLLQVTVQLALCLYLATLRGDRALRAVVLYAMLLTILAGPLVYEGTWSYLRAFALMPVGIWLLCIQTGKRWPILLQIPLIFWPVAAVLEVWVGRVS